MENKWVRFNEKILDIAKEFCGITLIANLKIKRKYWWSAEPQQIIKTRKMHGENTWSQSRQIIYNIRKGVKNTVCKLKVFPGSILG